MIQCLIIKIVIASIEPVARDLISMTKLIRNIDKALVNQKLGLGNL